MSWLHQKGTRLLLTAFIPVAFSVPNATANASSSIIGNDSLNLKTGQVIALFDDLFDDDDDDLMMMTTMMRPCLIPIQ